MTEISEMSVQDQLRNQLRDVRHDLEHVVRERDAAKNALEHVLVLWGKETKSVRIEPGNILAIGGVDFNHGLYGEQFEQAIQQLRDATGASLVWLFTGDIDVRAVQLNRADESKPFFSDVDVAVENGVIKLYGDGDELIADLPGDRAQILRDGLGDGIVDREEQLKTLASMEGGLLDD